MFYFRADGNEKIAMGHVMRCLTIAEALRERGEKVLFLTADESPVQFIEKRGFGERYCMAAMMNWRRNCPGSQRFWQETVGKGGQVSWWTAILLHHIIWKSCDSPQR